MYFTGKPCKYGHVDYRQTSKRTCMQCNRNTSKEQYNKNKDVYNKRTVQWKKDNPEKAKEASRRSNSKNYLRYKAGMLISNAKRKAQKLNATPIWANSICIAQLYKECPEGSHVDHIVPLRSRLVCGLHCEDNMQYLTMSVNLSKGNRYWPDMWEV